MIDDDREWLENGGERSGVARPEILHSWRRSQLSRVNPDQVTIVPGEAHLDSKIAKVAIPVLGSMADILIGANTSLLLSAPDGTMLWRWSEDSRLSALLDRRCAVVGTRWNEDIVGTNGLGTALETVRPIMVNGAEHFSTALHGFTCAGAPIRHPITRRVAGVLSVTSLVEDANPLMAPTLLKLVREVEEQLYSASTLRERELFHHFLAERRRGRNAVVAVNDDVVIANTAGARLQVDYRALWHQVESGFRNGGVIELESPDDVDHLEWWTIEHAGSVVGLVIVAEPAGLGKGPPEGAASARSDGGGRPLQWSELPALLRTYAGGCDRLLVAGEVGVGKRALLREAFGTTDRPLREFDCAVAEEIGSEQWLAGARSALSGDDAVLPGLLVLSHIETLTPSSCRVLGRILDQLPRGGGPLAVAATWTPTGWESDPAARALLDRFASATFEVPPLRKRPDDVLCRLIDQGPGVPVLTDRAVEQVRLHPWPGNHRQLEEFRRWLCRQSQPIIDIDDLPPRWSREAARARLTAIQAAEAEVIATALRANRGNKAAAATRLGISRSSLYRKMREYRLR